eukprot:CAMPEP_0175042330 /NCGR_PEP_ID=MMETSP0052_2-20121109/2496_1 /TAXON_ID=51329 ORGANISM="Polytomella parva, Strain SAG 63-3" /NCGR_SAMPLE_ID=MMETSP0052_2 /ASSEMBLY_ACC=CAM_ASM_000194 /LENGTH=1048 /DNA_ID=CAMNT_0016305115 /DNA_START=148 /DNA_END=3291 /DNA_ORIENTATION=-
MEQGADSRPFLSNPDNCPQPETRYFPFQDTTNKSKFRTLFSLYALPIAILGLCIGLGVWGIEDASKNISSYKKELGQKSADSIVAEFRYETSKVFYSLKALESVVAINPSLNYDIKDFNDAVSVLFSSDDASFSSTLLLGATSAPFGVVSNIYESNNSSTNNNESFWSNAFSGAWAKQFVASRSPGLVSLPDSAGGKLLFIRPIFLPVSSSNQTWGMNASELATNFWASSSCGYCFDKSSMTKFWGFTAVAMNRTAFLDVKRLATSEQYDITVVLSFNASSDTVIASSSLSATASSPSFVRRSLLDSGSSFGSESSISYESTMQLARGTWRPGWWSVAIAFTVLGAVILAVAHIIMLAANRIVTTHVVLSNEKSSYEDFQDDYLGVDGGSPAERIMFVTSQLLRGEMPSYEDVSYVREAVRQNADIYATNVTAYLEDLNEQDAEVTLALMKELGHMAVPAAMSTPFAIHTHSLSAENLRDSPEMTLQNGLDMILNQDVSRMGLSHHSSVMSHQHHSHPYDSIHTVTSIGNRDVSVAAGALGATSGLGSTPGSSGCLTTGGNYSAAAGATQSGDFSASPSVRHHHLMMSYGNAVNGVADGCASADLEGGEKGFVGVCGGFGPGLGPGIELIHPSGSNLACAGKIHASPLDGVLDPSHAARIVTPLKANHPSPFLHALISPGYLGKGGIGNTSFPPHHPHHPHHQSVNHHQLQHHLRQHQHQHHNQHQHQHLSPMAGADGRVFKGSGDGEGEDEFVDNRTGMVFNCHGNDQVMDEDELNYHVKTKRGDAIKNNANNMLMGARSLPVSAHSPPFAAQNYLIAPDGSHSVKARSAQDLKSKDTSLPPSVSPKTKSSLMARVRSLVSITGGSSMTQRSSLGKHSGSIGNLLGVFNHVSNSTAGMENTAFNAAGNAIINASDVGINANTTNAMIDHEQKGINVMNGDSGKDVLVLSQLPNNAGGRMCTAVFPYADSASAATVPTTTTILTTTATIISTDPSHSVNNPDGNNHGNNSSISNNLNTLSHSYNNGSYKNVAINSFSANSDGSLTSAS